MDAYTTERDTVMLERRGDPVEELTPEDALELAQKLIDRVAYLLDYSVLNTPWN